MSLSGALPSLTTLRVHFLKDDWAGDSVFVAFDRLPSLERFSVIGDATAVIRRGDLFSWDKILHFSAQEDTECVPDLVDHYQVLPRLTNVQTCSLDTCLPDSLHDNPPPQPTLTLSFLHTLVLTVFFRPQFRRDFTLAELAGPTCIARFAVPLRI
ncbi:hypothetical protein PM082_014332 [Marasmius tenuissimus]|nr:hypothetical protein PM082_014332 [Marasmius tenuissimus]